MKHKTRGFIAMILALCLMMSLGIGALAQGSDSAEGDSASIVDDGGNNSETTQSGGPTGPGDAGAGDAPAPQADETYNLARQIGEGLSYDTISVSEGGTYNNGEATAGATITFQVWASGVTLDDNQEIIVTLNGTEVNPTSTTGRNTYSITMPSQDSVLAARIATYYDITTVVTPTGGGSVNVSKTRAEQGDVITVSASAASNYELETLKWSYDSSSEDINSGGTFTMPASNVTVTATFKATEPDPEPAKYTVSANTGNFTISGTGDYEKDEIVSLTITPNTGYYLYSVRIDGEYKEPGAGGYYTFEMPGHDVSVQVVAKPYSDWRDWHNIDTYSNSVDGGISVASGALEGSTVTFRVWSNFKYDYNYDYRVYVTNDRTGATVKYDYDAYYDEYSFTMPDDDVTISVYFDHVGDYTITKDVEGDGSIYVQSSADYDEPVWITVKPGSGQSLTSLRVFREDYGWYQTSDGKWHGYGKAEVDVEYSEYYDAYYFYMPADDVVVYARFTDGATVTVTSGDHGSAKVSSRYAEKGDWVYITAYPDDGYEVADVTVVDRLGKSVKVTELSSDYFLFTMPGTSVDVKVTFREVDYGYFYDVSRGDWYYEAVRYVYEKGIMEGTSAHYFSPNADLSRGMLATILYRLEGSPNVSGYSSFNDVADTSYYAKAIAWAERNGIVNGVTTERFEPDTAVAR